MIRNLTVQYLHDKINAIPNVDMEKLMSSHFMLVLLLKKGQSYKVCLTYVFCLSLLVPHLSKSHKVKLNSKCTKQAVSDPDQTAPKHSQQWQRCWIIRRGFSEVGYVKTWYSNTIWPERKSTESRPHPDVTETATCPLWHPQWNI